MPVIGLPTLTWLQAYCLLFAVKALFGSKSETETTKTIKSIIDGTCTKYGDYDIPDEVMIIMLTILETVIASVLYLIIGWFLSYFLYM